jgi:hypothetical protein
MIEKLVRLKNWQIALLGVTAVVVALSLVTFVAHLCYASFPGSWGVIAVLHMLAAGGAAWFIPAPFLDAYLVKKYTAEADAALAHIIEMLGEAFPEGHEVTAGEEPTHG